MQEPNKCFWNVFYLNRLQRLLQKKWFIFFNLSCATEQSAQTCDANVSVLANISEEHFQHFIEPVVSRINAVLEVETESILASASHFNDLGVTQI